MNGPRIIAPLLIACMFFVISQKAHATETPTVQKTVCTWSASETDLCLQMRSTQKLNLALYQRSGSYWAILDTSAPIDIPKIAPAQAHVVRDIQILKSHALTFLKITLHDSYRLQLGQNEAGWDFTLTHTPQMKEASPYVW